MTSETPLYQLNDQAAPPQVAAIQGAQESDDVSLLDLLIVLAERKHLILKTTAVFALLAIVVSLLLPKIYTATVTLLPPQQNTSMGAMLASQMGGMSGMAALAGGGALSLKNPNDKYVALLKSRTVEDGMVQHFGLLQEYHAKLLSEARTAFENHSTVEDTEKDDLIHISVKDTDPRRAAELANGYVNQFRDLSQSLAITEASQRRLFFQQELEQAKDNLATAEESLTQTELKTGVIEPESQERALIQSAATLRAEINEREVEIQGMKTYATGENSQLVQAQQELQGMRTQLAALGGSEDNGGSDLIMPKGRVSEAGMEYVRKLRDVKYSETIFDILARQFEVAKLDEAKEGSLIQVVDPAIVPDRRSSPKRALIVLGGIIFGAFIGTLAALLQAGFRHVREDPETGLKLSILRRTISA